MVRVFGEVLWDIFGEKKEIGGAPFNFAVQMKRQGFDVQFISAVGRDELGQETVSIVKQMGLSTNDIIANEWPTGYCQVTLKDGTPEYELAMPVAYDHIEVNKETPEVRDSRNEEKCDGKKCTQYGNVLYFGTLAQRGEKSRETLKNILKNNSGDVFFDINIRQNFYTKEIIDESLKASTILKISREEIGVLESSGLSQAKGSSKCCQWEENLCRVVMEKYPNLKLIIVTLDKDGAFVYDGTRCVYSDKPRCKVVSTVGAGDAFAAGYMAGYIQGLNTEECLKKAMSLAGEVCERLGAL